jgi:hypothetical protein
MVLEQVLDPFAVHLVRVGPSGSDANMLADESTPPRAAMVAPPVLSELLPPGAAWSFTLGISPIVFSVTLPTHWVL